MHTYCKSISIEETDIVVVRHVPAYMVNACKVLQANLQAFLNDKCRVMVFKYQQGFKVCVDYSNADKDFGVGITQRVRKKTRGKKDYLGISNTIHKSVQMLYSDTLELISEMSDLASKSL